MMTPVKLLVIIIVPVALFVAAVFGITTTLSIDDLKRCDATPSQQDTSCAAVDAIVAISGGDTQSRTAEAVALYKAGWAPKLILSGAAEDKTGLSNAEAMRQDALEAGVPDHAILLDEQANDTAANAAGIGVIARYDKLQRIILVTSPYHQRRASIEFARALGPTTTIVNHPTPNDRFWSDYWWLNPFSWYLALSELGKLVYVNLSGK